MNRYAPRKREMDLGVALAIRLERIRATDERFQAGIEAMRQRAREVIANAPDLDSADFYTYMVGLGGFKKVLMAAFEACVGDAVEANVPADALWGAIALRNALTGGEWLEIKNAAIAAHREAQARAQVMATEPVVGYMVVDPEANAPVSYERLHRYPYLAASEESAFRQAAEINRARDAHNDDPRTVRQLSPVTVVEYPCYWNGAPA